jgi:hypothetical protein
MMPWPGLLVKLFGSLASIATEPTTLHAPVGSFHSARSTPLKSETSSPFKTAGKASVAIINTASFNLGMIHPTSLFG